MNWANTEVPLWQIDCENFRKLGRSFELRHVKTPEHEAFVSIFAGHYDLEIARVGDCVTFSPNVPPKRG